MVGIQYQLTDNKILAIIPDVLEVTETSIKGQNHSLNGIDATQAGIKVIEPFAVNITYEDITQEVLSWEEVDGVPKQVMEPVVIGQREIIKVILVEGVQELGEGDIIDPAALTDTRAMLPKTKDQEINDLQAQLAETQNAINFLLGL